jgi:hypothetical protein
MNDTQKQALAALEAALPFLVEASKLSERDDFEPEASKGAGAPVACRAQDALYHAQNAIDGLRHGTIDRVRASYIGLPPRA